MKDSKEDDSDSDKSSASDDDMDDSESIESQHGKQQLIEQPKSFIEELSSVTDSDDEKKDFL